MFLQQKFFIMNNHNVTDHPKAKFTCETLSVLEICIMTNGQLKFNARLEDNKKKLQ